MILIYTLVCLVIFIIAILNAKILNISKYQAYQHRMRDYKGDDCHQAKSCCKASDIVCYISLNQKKIEFPPQDTRLNDDAFSSNDLNPATKDNKTKRLIFQLKILFKKSLVLLKYRFLIYIKSLEVIQAKVIDKAKLSQNKDSLSMLKGLVLGEKDTDNSYYSSFARAGMIHVLVASGFNVSLLAGYFNQILIFLPKKIKTGGIILIIWFYTWLLGGEAPLLRASLMMSVNLILLEKGLMIHSRRILFFSAVILLIIDPSLLESLSFWFSFLATAGLVFFHNRFLLFSSGSDDLVAFFRTEFFSSLSAQLLIIPLVVAFFSELNWLGFITNSIFLFPVAWFTQVGFALIIFFSLLKNTHFSFILWPFSLLYRHILLFFIFMVSQAKKLFFLQDYISPEEKPWFLLCWMLVIIVLIVFLRGKSNKESVFFHENH